MNNQSFEIFQPSSTIYRWQVPPGIISWKMQPRTIEKKISPRVDKIDKSYVKLYLVCFYRSVTQGSPWWLGWEGIPPPPSQKKSPKIFELKLKSWAILPVASSLFLIFSKEFLKFTPFLQLICAIKSVENFNILCVGSCDNPHQSPTVPLSSTDGRTLI